MSLIKRHLPLWPIPSAGGAFPQPAILARSLAVHMELPGRQESSADALMRDEAVYRIDFEIG